MIDIDKIRARWLDPENSSGTVSKFMASVDIHTLCNEAERLREALVKHGTHEESCLAGMPLPEGGCVQCSCGLSAALATDQPEKGEPTDWRESKVRRPEGV